MKRILFVCLASLYLLAGCNTIEGMGKGAKGWFPVAQAYVSYDHPMNLE